MEKYDEVPLTVECKVRESIDSSGDKRSTRTLNFFNYITCYYFVSVKAVLGSVSQR